MGLYMGDIIYKEVIFMELLEYIRKNYKTPNVAVLRTLGASEELIKYLINTPNNTNMKVVESFISEGGDEGNGVKSVSISPAITTTPALDSLFPIYYEDLTDEQKRDDVRFTGEPATALVDGATYTITATPTDSMFVTNGHGVGSASAGAPITFTETVEEGELYFLVTAVDSTSAEQPEKIVTVRVDIYKK